MTAAQQYTSLVEEFLTHDGVGHKASPAGFGASSLTVDNKIFAMLVKEQLVVKLPARRVDSLVRAAGGACFDPGPRADHEGMVRRRIGVRGHLA
jgi:hypothetical protein